MSMKQRSLGVTLVTAGALALLFCWGCNGPLWPTCKSNPEHEAQPGCVCPCNNDPSAEVCSDENNACCYGTNGACRNSTTATPDADAGAAASLTPSNKDAVRGTLMRCLNETGTCSNAYPLLPCQAFYERVGYRNFSDVEVGPPEEDEFTPRLIIGPGAPLPYAFTYPPKDVPWGTLAPGQTQEVPIEIRTTGSGGTEVAGFDPGAQQCAQSASFVVQVLNVPELSLHPNGVYDGPLVQGLLSEPFGSCSPGPGC